MAKNTISALAPYAPCLVNIRGNVTYSHIAKLIEGAELEKDKQRKIANGQIPIQKPYTALTIENARVIDDGKLNPVVKDFFENGDKIKTKIKEDGTAVKMYYGTSKSPNPPSVAYGAEAGNLAGQGIASKDVPLASELAIGLDVTIGVKIYKGTNSQTNTPYVGIGMDYIIVNEPIRYYSGNSLENQLKEQGVTYTPPTAKAETVPQAVSPMATAPVQNTPVQQAPVQQAPVQNVQPAQPQVVTQQVPQQVVQQAPVQAAPVQAAPVQQAVPQQAAPQQAQAAASPMVATTYPQGGANFEQQAQPQAAAPVQQAAPQPQQQPTLQYVPN